MGLRDTRDDADPALAWISSRVSCVVALAGHFDLGIAYPQEFDRQSVVALLEGTADEVQRFTGTPRRRRGWTVTAPRS